MPSYKIGRGFKTAIGTIAGNVVTYTELAGVTDIELPSPEADEVEVSNFGSPGRSREFIAGLEDNGEASITTLYDIGSATDLALSNAYSSKATVAIKFQPNGVANANAEVWLGYCKSYTLEVSDGEVMKKTATFRISAPYTGA